MYIYNIKRVFPWLVLGILDMSPNGNRHHCSGLSYDNECSIFFPREKKVPRTRFPREHIVLHGLLLHCRWEKQNNR